MYGFKHPGLGSASPRDCLFVHTVGRKKTFPLSVEALDTEAGLKEDCFVSAEVRGAACENGLIPRNRFGLRHQQILICS